MGTEKKMFGPNGIKLKQIQFRSYMHDIMIYHFQAYHISLRNFRSLLNRQEHGYVDTLISFDALVNMPVPEGDEVPQRCLEVGYLPTVFRYGGSALGFRVGDNVIEWMCFDRPIDDIILNKLDVYDRGPGAKLMLFDHVANLDKGLTVRRVKGATPEHKAWHTSLWKAKYRHVSLSLTWKNFGTELQKQHALQRLEYGIVDEVPEADDDDVNDADADEKGVDNYGVFTYLDGEHSKEGRHGGTIDENEDEIMTNAYEDKHGGGDEQTTDKTSQQPKPSHSTGPGDNSLPLR